MNLDKSRTWLITGVAGFIGSHLLQTLLSNNQKVIGIDNFVTGHRDNLTDVKLHVTSEQWAHFHFLESDITHDIFEDPVRQADIILHQAALGSVPRSIENPINTHKNNVDGFINLLNTLKKYPEKRLVYASSSSVYGDSPQLPKKEEVTGSPQSPYAATKLINEIYAKNFAHTYHLNSIGLRYFNVFGSRQDPEGAYAAVIPRWSKALIKNMPVTINGDGSTSRDFCYVDNVVEANLLAATTENPQALNQVFNVALGDKITLLELYSQLKKTLLSDFPQIKNHEPHFAEFRKGDILHSQADISKARTLLGFAPQFDFKKGLQAALPWYIKKYKN